MQRLLRPREVAVEYGLPRDLVYEALHDGRLRSFRRGRNYYTTPACVAAWIESEVNDPTTHNAAGDKTGGEVELLT